MKTIIITGATDGIGKETAIKLAKQRHHLLLHGRSQEKLDDLEKIISQHGNAYYYKADLSNLDDVRKLSDEIKAAHTKIDVLINNAGVFKMSDAETKYGIDARFIVNTIAPYILTHDLLSHMDEKSRIINLSSAAQAHVNLDALSGKIHTLEDMDAYAQSKLAITMWSRALAENLHKPAPTVVAVNPGSLLASKMVKEGFNVDGKSLDIGADILVKLSTEDNFIPESGLYFDNDIGKFGPPHDDALQPELCQDITNCIENFLQ